MRRLCVTIILTLGACSNAIGMNYLGPPTTRMRLGQWYVGASYTDGEQDVEVEAPSGSEVEFRDNETNLALARIGVGLATDRLEIFGLIGAADTEWGIVESDDEFATGAGFRTTLYLDKTNNLDYGVVGQFVYYKSEDSSYELSVSDVQFGIGPCWRPGPWMLYGGALIQAIDGDLESSLQPDYDIGQESWFGVYLGGGVDIGEHWTLTGEAQATPDAFAWGIGAQLRF